MARTFPAVVINGILESGKTRFICSSLKNGDFGNIGRVLILSQEEGEEEYDNKELSKFGAFAYVFSSPEEFTVEKINQLIKEHKPAAVFFEMNAMWDNENLKFPPYILVEQSFTIIDASTFKTYFNNMRQKFSDMVKASDVIIMNRCKDTPEMAGYKRSLKLINKDAAYYTYDENGASISFADDLPYKLGDEIKISDGDFGVFYIDTFDNIPRYDGKTVEFNCMCVTSKQLPKNTFVAGRLAMTCCANDIQLIGHLCACKAPVSLKDRQWLHLRAKMHYSSAPNGEVQIVLEMLSFKPIPEISDPVVSLV
ncbi:MAG: hypothetical protein IJS67_04950 [Clostridia bacterium]|nr:hypothetical protein [Clostridia bacterium]